MAFAALLALPLQAQAQIITSTDATLSALTVNDGTNDLILTPAFVSGTYTYAANAGNAVTSVTLSATTNHTGASVSSVTLGGTAIADTDFTDEITVPSLVEGDNVIVVTVTAEDTSTTQPYTVTVTRARRMTTTPTPPAEVTVPNDWSLIPTGLAAGDKFRLLLLSSTKTGGESYDIVDYNSFIQSLAAAGHTDIQAYSSGFRAVGCTADSDARDNTGTTGTGVPIYWLRGNKVADNNADFYDGSWGDEANDTNEQGTDAHDTSQPTNYPLTGCAHDGTESFSGTVSRALGGYNRRVARPNSSTSGHGPLSSPGIVIAARPMYGLSQVFEVADSTLSTDATLSDLELEDNTGTAITLTPTFAPATTSYKASVANTVDEITIAPTVNDSNAEYEIQDSGGTALTDADLNTTGFQVALSEGANTIKVEVTAEDDSTPETYTVVVTREMMTTTPTALALSIADASASENAGHLLFEVTLSRALPNTVKVDFETISGGTATEGVDYYARRTYTHVILAGDTTAQMGFALIDDTVDDAGETVKVRLSNARVVDAYGDKIKDLDITTAEATGTITAPPASTTNVPGLTIRIQDTTGDEDDGWLVFKVRLSQTSDDYVCYDFESISGGTATEGTDYSKRPTVWQWVEIGKRVDTPFVRIIDDSVNDNGETVKVKISNARLCDDASQTVFITRAEATGTIRNSDPLPRALMARFGRTAAVHVVEHVEERLAAPREVGVEAQVAGRQLRPGMERELALDFLRQLGSSAGMHARGAGSPGARSGSPMGAAAGSIGLAAGMGGPAGGGMGVAADPMNGMAGPDGGLFDRGLRSMGLGGEHLLTSSSFALTRETRQGGILSFWSRGARSSFAGREEALSLGGDVRTMMVGADYAKGPLVTGLSLSNSRGLGEYAGVTAGQVASAVTGLYPWLGYTLSDRVSVWGVTGYGKGALTLTPGEGAALTSGLSMAMAAAGTRGALVAGGASGFELAFKADALWVGTSIDGVEGPGGNLAATAAAVTRFRTGLEGARATRSPAGCRCGRASRSGCGTTAGTPRPAPAWTSAAGWWCRIRRPGWPSTCGCGCWPCTRPTGSGSGAWRCRSATTRRLGRHWG